MKIVAKYLTLLALLFLKLLEKVEEEE